MSSYGDDVIAMWDECAQAPSARALIHPTGAQGDAAYEESGCAQAEQLARIFAAHEITHVLDYGCGDGRVALPLGDLGLWVYAVDTSPAMIGRLRAEQNYYLDSLPHVAARVIDDELVLTPEAFGGAYCLAVLIHQSWHDGAVIVERLRDAVKPGGIVILDIPLYAEPAESGSWIGVTTWSRAQLDAVCWQAGLDVVGANESPGAYTPGHPGPWHSEWIVTRRCD